VTEKIAMFIPPGFTQKSVQTSLGKIVYYTNDRSPWTDLKANLGQTLVFLHGLGGGSSAYEWSKVYPAFAAEYRILAPDLLGGGRSEHPERDYKVDDYLTTIAEFLSNTCSFPVIVIASALTVVNKTFEEAIAPLIYSREICYKIFDNNNFSSNYFTNRHD
jgi:hypothetical protein